MVQPRIHVSRPSHQGQPAASGYERIKDLPRLLRLWPEEAARLGDGDQVWLVAKLRDMLRSERQRGLTRHWSYDLSRHAALMRAYRAEAACLKRAQSRPGTQQNKERSHGPLTALRPE